MDGWFAILIAPWQAVRGFWPKGQVEPFQGQFFFVPACISHMNCVRSYSAGSNCWCLVTAALPVCGTMEKARLFLGGPTMHLPHHHHLPHFLSLAQISETTKILTFSFEPNTHNPVAQPHFYYCMSICVPILK